MCSLHQQMQPASRGKTAVVKLSIASRCMYAPVSALQQLCRPHAGRCALRRLRACQPAYLWAPVTGFPAVLDGLSAQDAGSEDKFLLAVLETRHSKQTSLSYISYHPGPLAGLDDNTIACKADPAVLDSGTDDVGFLAVLDDLLRHIGSIAEGRPTVPAGRPFVNMHGRIPEAIKHRCRQAAAEKPVAGQFLPALSANPQAGAGEPHVRPFFLELSQQETAQLMQR